MGILRFISLLLVTLIPLSAISQPVTPDKDLEYILEDFTLPGGRLGNNVNAIVEGPYGFLWFGTHGGLHRYDGYSFKTYKKDPADTTGTSYSLVFPYIENLYWDSDDILWIASYGDGVFRFDPKTEIFRHYEYKPDDPKSISNPRVLSIVEDNEGSIWLGTENGLNRFDQETETFKKYFADSTDAKTLHNDDVRSLYVDKEGTLWVGTGFIWLSRVQGALSKYDPASDSFVNYIVKDPNEPISKPEESPIRGIKEDLNGNFWIAAGKGLYKMDKEKETFRYMSYNPNQPYPPGELDRDQTAVFDIMEDSKGALWIGTIMDYSYPSHLLRYDPEKGISQIFPLETAAWCITETSDGVIWIGGAGDSGQVKRIKPKSNTFSILKGLDWPDSFLSNIDRLGLKDSSMFGPIKMAMDPRDSTLWSLYIMNLSEFQDSTQLFMAHYFPKDETYDFTFLSDLYIQLNFEVPANQFGSIGMQVDKNGNIWGTVETSNVGLFRFNPETNDLTKFYHNPDDSLSISSNHIVKTIIDRSGNIWAATWDQGLNRVNTLTGDIHRYHFPSNFRDDNDSPVALMEGLDGKIWVAGDLLDDFGKYVIVIIDPETDERETISLNKGDVFNGLNSLAQSPKNGLVMFSILNNGIGTYDPENEELLYYNTGNSPLPFDRISNIVSDNEGNFWLSEIDSENFVVINQNFEFLSFKEGSAVSRNVMRSGFLGSNGTVYFRNNTFSGGWFELNSEIIKLGNQEKRKKSKIVELSVLGVDRSVDPSVSDKPIWLTDQVTLKSNASSFTFKFTDFNYTGSNPNFQYRLYPHDSAWVKNINNTIASFHKIPYGEYSFQLKSSTTGLSRDEFTLLAITILPPWYRTWWAYAGYVIIFAFGIFGVHTFQKERTIRRERERAKDRELEQAKEIEKAYEELKITQQQLIHSEKMASLGEMTAGIAHEIQNPLNFINNFSDVNKELAEELNDEIKKGNIKELGSIISDIIENEQKIIHHGNRADSIVKSMLQHSRGSSGEMVPTDINALCDEYIRLAYHGLRAKDKSFNADFKLKLDESLSDVNVVPQDIGRVLLNLINNGFQAVSQKSKAESNDDYKPEVVVTTENEENGIKISVKDNGLGIPDAIKDRIFEPFFTTKDAGQGTGLGLSMSYDIIAQGHGGEIKVKSNEGEGSEFIVKIPNL